MSAGISLAEADTDADDVAVGPAPVEDAADVCGSVATVVDADTTTVADADECCT